MSLVTYYREHGWIRSAVAVSAIMIVILAVIILMGYFFQKAIIDRQGEIRCREISASIVGGMTDALAVGDNETVRQQFRRLEEMLPEADVYVYDFNGRISFSTNDKTIGRSFNEFLSSPELAAKSDTMLETGEARGMFELQVENDPYVGIMVPSLNEKKCFHCHGSSRKVLGGIAVMVNNQEARDAVDRTRNLSIIAGGAGVIVVIFVIWLIFAKMVRRLNRHIDKIKTTSRDVKDSSESLRRLSGQIKENARQGSDMGSAMSSAAQEISDHINSIASASEQVSVQIKDVSMNSEMVSQEIDSVNQNLSVVSSNIGSVAAAAEQMSFAVNTIATAMEQMYASQNEITKSSSKCASITNTASVNASRTFDIVNKLQDAAAQIGDVIEMINTIAGKTNLLALNAAIEAAGAGDAGKGFAVVAKEVKELARQTESATEDIRKKVAGMQSHTKEAIGAITDITSTITQVDNIMGTIASSVEEQAATTNEVSRNMAESAESADSVAKNINSAAEKTGAVLESMKHIAAIETSVSQNLGETVTAVNEIARDVASVSARTDRISEHADTLSKKIDGIMTGTREQTDQSEEMARVADRLKKVTKEFKI